MARLTNPARHGSPRAARHDSSSTWRAALRYESELDALDADLVTGMLACGHDCEAWPARRDTILTKVDWPSW